MTRPHTYTRENLTDLLIRYTNALGRAPKTEDLRSTRLKTVFFRWVSAMGIADDQLQSFGPSRNVICNVFGVKTWAGVLEAAGLTEMVVEHKKPYGTGERKPWSREDVIAAYQEIICTEGILPGQEEQKNLYKLRTKFFSSEEEVVTAGGFDYEFLRKMTNRVKRMRREGLKSAGYYEALITVYPVLAKYSREYIDKYKGKNPVKVVKKEIYDRMGEVRNPGPETISPAEHWKLWQKYYQKELYHTPAEEEPHEVMLAQAIMMSTSPGDAFTRITTLSRKYPSSVGANPADEFRRLWVTTRNEVLPPHQRLKHPGHIQLVRPRKAG